MDSEDLKVKGVVEEVGLERDRDQFSSFNLKIGMVIKSSKVLTYDQGEKLMKSARKELLGREVEITAIVVPCPICGKGFNTEQGMKQHVRMVHEKKKKGKTQKPKKKKTKSTRKSSSRKTTKKSDDR